MTAIKCKHCGITFSSLLIPSQAAVEEVLLLLSRHSFQDHPQQVKDGINHLNLLMQLLTTYVVPNELGVCDGSLTLEGVNPVEQFMKQTHKLIIEAINPPTPVDIRSTVQVN